MNQGKVKGLKGCLFSVIVDGILESTHLMGCSGTKDKKIYTTETTTGGLGSF